MRTIIIGMTLLDEVETPSEFSHSLVPFTAPCTFQIIDERGKILSQHKKTAPLSRTESDRDISSTFFGQSDSTQSESYYKDFDGYWRTR